jgi:flavin reductase (DIM6/NTAB) family NADH-FMN oxidoreductase RutF
LTEAIGYVQCKCVGSIDSGDHELFVCEVLKQVTLNPDKEVLTNNYLRENGLVRG